MLQYTEIFLLALDKDNSNILLCYPYIIKLRQVDTHPYTYYQNISLY